MKEPEEASKAQLSARQTSELKMIEITEANISQYTFDDVIFPIVGYKVKMPAHPGMRKIVEDIMAEDNMSIDKFTSQAQMVSISATGSYRKIIGKAENIQFDIVESTNPSEDLLTPDYLAEKDPEPVIDPEGTITKALRIKFSLKPSNYATMFLREVTKTSSAFDVQHQISKNNN